MKESDNNDAAAKHGTKPTLFFCSQFHTFFFIHQNVKSPILRLSILLLIDLLLSYSFFF